MATQILHGGTLSTEALFPYSSGERPQGGSGRSQLRVTQDTDKLPRLHRPGPRITAARLKAIVRRLVHRPIDLTIPCISVPLVPDLRLTAPQGEVICGALVPDSLSRRLDRVG